MMRLNAVLSAKKPPIFRQHFLPSENTLDQVSGRCLPTFAGVVQYLRKSCIAECFTVIE